MDEVCQKLGISRSIAYGTADLLKRRMLYPQVKTPIEKSNDLLQREIIEKDFEIAILRYEVEHPGSREAGVRTHFDPAYKSFVNERRNQAGLSVQKASEILSIPLDTLKKFSRNCRVETEATKLPDRLSESAVDLVNTFLRAGKGIKTVKGFCERNQALLAELGMSYRKALSWLRHLGLVSERGIFLKNKGMDRIIRFKPNMVWGTDGKIMQVAVRGEVFTWVWQCLVDGATTVYVGNIVSHGETTENLKKLLELGEKNSGMTPLAIVIDNRLSENLPAIKEYLDSRGIVIVKTFPGNPKSNGITEGNFSVFESWVGGKVEISGNTNEEISKSIAEMLVEVFTQLRSHAPRKSLSNKSATEVMSQIPPATHEETVAAKEKLQELADRFKSEQAQPLLSEQKKVAIEQAIQHAKPKDGELFRTRLKPSIYTADLILQSIAVFERAKQKFPEKNYDHTYYAGILRNHANDQAVEWLNTHLEASYVHHWETMGQIKEQDLGKSVQSHPVSTCSRLAKDFLSMPIPAYTNRILLDLKECFYLASRGSVEIASELRKSLTEIVLQSKRDAHSKRERLLKKLYEWENFVRLCDRNLSGTVTAPAGHA
jgi:hypothetical protein